MPQYILCRRSPYQLRAAHKPSWRCGAALGAQPMLSAAARLTRNAVLSFVSRACAGNLCTYGISGMLYAMWINKLF